MKLTSGQDQVVLITRDGMSIRFSEEDVRSMGRPAAGVRGISLEKGDAVVALAVVVPDATLLVAGENGIGKRTPFDMVLQDGTLEPVYRLQSRGGKGIITMKTNEKTGAVVGALTVRDADEIMLITDRRPDGAHLREGHPRSRPQHPGREADQPGAKATSCRPSPRSSASSRKTPPRGRKRPEGVAREG